MTKKKTKLIKVQEYFVKSFKCSLIF